MGDKSEKAETDYFKTIKTKGQLLIDFSVKFDKPDVPSPSFNFDLEDNLADNSVVKPKQDSAINVKIKTISKVENRKSLF